MDKPDLDALLARLRKIADKYQAGTARSADVAQSLEDAANALTSLLAHVRELEYGLDDAQKLRNIWQNVSRELATDCDVLREIVQSAIALLEIDAEADDPATDVYAFLKHARAKVTL